jgi:hypothetical protein
VSSVPDSSRSVIVRLVLSIAWMVAVALTVLGFGDRRVGNLSGSETDGERCQRQCSCHDD